ncbi:MAG: DegT/DnrJ/EryC1/StrS family aminotransferase [Candidatus Woesebacteria bacterium]|nr:DegT/DnrJ/EryC1/StrS family aminotransferase [Candidatus Woesebacteria bacterium]
MRIFNSLGSNYNSYYLLRGFFNVFNENKNNKLKSLLEKKYNGKVIFYYKGREAIEVALRILSLPKNSYVAINGLTCLVVDKAVTNAGYKCQYLDIGEDLNFSPNSLHKALIINSNIKAVIVQNTLGIPVDIQKIKKICDDNQLVLIEDLAHCAGTVYGDGGLAGTIGDFTVLSFSQDKIIDSVSGGALIIRNKKYLDKIAKTKKKNIPITWIIRDILYPKFTFIIRNLYYLNIGKVIHRLLRISNLLSIPIDLNVNNLHNLPKWYINMAYDYIINLDFDLIHRKKISKIYSDNLNNNIIAKDIITKLNKSTNIRFPIFAKNRNKLVKYLEHGGIYISDIWYDSPVAPLKFQSISNYKKGTCSNAEKLSELILNLPTHKNINENEALNISKLINKWITTQ